MDKKTLPKIEHKNKVLYFESKKKWLDYIKNMDKENK